jgi:hypothetical protein
MDDVVFLALAVGFFVVAVLVVRACELVLRAGTTGEDGVGS